MIRFILSVLLISFNSHAEQFKVRSSSLTEEASLSLQRIYEEKIKGKDVSVVIEGHTDSRGSDAYNYKLSLARAQTAAAKLISLGLDKDKITIVGKGESELISKRHVENRRIVIVIDEAKVACKCPQDIVREKEIIIKKHKHIVSLVVNRSVTDYDVSHPSSSITRVENRYELTPGIMYQNNITGNWYVGGQLDTNKSVGFNLGYGF